MATLRDIQGRLLMSELGLTPETGSVGIGKDHWFVIIYRNCRKPPLIKWMGLPVEYYIGCGMPVAHNAEGISVSAPRPGVADAGGEDGGRDG